jgi:hypothetical protein
MDLLNYSLPPKADFKNIVAMYRAFGFYVPQEHFGALLKRFPESRVGGMNLRFRWGSGYTTKMIQKEINDYTVAIALLEEGNAASGPVSVMTGRKQMFETVLTDLKELETVAKELEFGDLIVKKKPARTLGDLLRDEMAKHE